MSRTIEGGRVGAFHATATVPTISIWCFVLLCSLLYSAPASAYCGFEDQEIDSAEKFADSYSGNLALKFGTKFYVLRRDNCTKFGTVDTHLRIYINHLGLTALSERAFLSVHAALLNPKDLNNIIYLFRNAKNGNQNWSEDKRGEGDYSSTHDFSHSDFNSDLQLSRDQFDAKYNNGKRKWNDKIANGEQVFETWGSRSNFAVRGDFIAAENSGRGGVRVQNYFINFTTGDRGKDDPLKRAPSFTMDAAGAKCIFLRISGSPNISANVGGEYILALNGTETCDSTINNLVGIGFFQWLFGIRN